MTFIPSVIGTRNGTLTLSDNALNSPQTVDLTGTGTGLAVELFQPLYSPSRLKCQEPAAPRKPSL